MRIHAIPDTFTRAFIMQLLDYCLNLESDCTGSYSNPSFGLLIVGPVLYMQKWEMQHGAGRPLQADIHEAWTEDNRPTFFKVGYTKVCGKRTYALVQEEFTSVRSIQDRFSARVLDSVWMTE
jgi:hypothetical protein